MDTEAFEVTLASELQQVRLLVETAKIGMAPESYAGRALADASARLAKLAKNADTYSHELQDRRFKARSARIRAITSRPLRRRRP